MNDVKYFICPMSKNILESILELDSDKLGVLPTRNQIDYTGGYVNNWSTKEFFSYINENFNTKNITFQRDHGGSSLFFTDEYESFKCDLKYFNIFHIDPWISFKNLSEGIEQTINYINYIGSRNLKAYFEIGTEEDRRKFEPDDIDFMLKTLRNNLSSDLFDRIIYVVIQSGESIDLPNKVNKGNFDINRFKDMIAVCKVYNKKSKEHNGDFLMNQEYQFRFNNGLSAVNIGPEFATIETSLYLQHMTSKQIDDFYQICLKTEKWRRWISCNVNDIDKKNLIEICGHYNYSNFDLPKIDNIIKDAIKDKIQSLLKIFK